MFSVSWLNVKIMGSSPASGAVEVLRPDDENKTCFGSSNKEIEETEQQ